MPDSSSKVEVVGLDDAAHDFRKWADQLGPAVQSASRSFAGRVATRVSSSLPHLTGALAASVHLVDVPEDGIGIGEGAGLDYAGWIEFGGSRGRPHVPQGRYLYPAALATDSEWHQLGEDITNQTIGRFPWSQAA
jgi:hypothetical protein